MQHGAELEGAIRPVGIQLAANRANAQFSTGPRTDAGKAQSSKNALKSALTDRKRSKALAELKALQGERLQPKRDRDGAESTSEAESDASPFASEDELFAALDAGYVPPLLAPYVNGNKPVNENGFVFSNDDPAPPEPLSPGA